MLQEMRNNIINKRFVLGVLLMMICFCGMSIPEWAVSADWGAEFRPSALQQSVIGIFFGGSMLLLPFCAALSCAPDQVNEIKSSIMKWKLLRSSLCSYSFRKVTSAFFTGGLTVATAFVIHAVIWNIIALPCDPFVHPYHEISFGEDCLYSTWYSICYGLPMYATITAGIFICAGTWSVVALGFAVWIPDRLLSITIPACVYYLLSASIFRTLLGWQLPHPATLYNDALTLESAIYSLLEYGIILMIAIGIYVAGLRRQNA